MAEDRRAPRLDVVEVPVAFGVDEVRAFGRSTKNGVPPTALNARTGELTPRDDGERALVELVAVALTLGAARRLRAPRR